MANLEQWTCHRLLEPLIVADLVHEISAGDVYDFSRTQVELQHRSVELGESASAGNGVGEIDIGQILGLATVSDHPQVKCLSVNVRTNQWSGGCGIATS